MWQRIRHAPEEVVGRKQHELVSAVGGIDLGEERGDAGDRAVAGGEIRPHRRDDEHGAVLRRKRRGDDHGAEALALESQVPSHEVERLQRRGKQDGG